jgi:hypothetical protein
MRLARVTISFCQRHLYLSLQHQGHFWNFNEGNLTSVVLSRVQKIQVSRQ